MSVPSIPKNGPSLPTRGHFLTFRSPGIWMNALVIDAQGRYGWHGAYCNGSGYSEKTAGTYAIPILTLLEDMEKNGWRRPTANMASLQD